MSVESVMVNTRVPWMEGRSLPDVCLGGLWGSGPGRAHAKDYNMRDGMITICAEI